MKIDHISKQLTKARTWKNEDGFSIETKRLTKTEKLKEISAFALAKEAVAVHNQLAKYKDHIREICQKVYDTYMEEKGANKTKGNFTWYNFDMSIKIEVSINEAITFDDLGIAACKEKLKSFINTSVDAKNEFIKDLVMAAFETKRGKLDSNKVMGLLRYRTKIDHEEFQEALNLIEESIRRPKSRTYFRIWAKDEAGSYQNIDLNLSSINE